MEQETVSVLSIFFAIATLFFAMHAAVLGFVIKGWRDSGVLGERLAGVDKRIEHLEGTLESFGSRLDGVERNQERLNGELAGVGRHLNGVETQVTHVGEELDRRMKARSNEIDSLVGGFGELRTLVTKRFNDFETRIDRGEWEWFSLKKRNPNLFSTENDVPPLPSRPGE